MVLEWHHLTVLYIMFISLRKSRSICYLAPSSILSPTLTSLGPLKWAICCQIWSDLSANMFFFCILHPKSSKRKIIVAPMSWTTHEGGSGRLQKRVVVYDESGGCPGRLKALDNPFRPINDQDPTGLYSLIQQQPPKNPKKRLGNFSSLNSGTCGWLPFKS